MSRGWVWVSATCTCGHVRLGWWACKSHVRAHGTLVTAGMRVMSHVWVCMSATSACVHVHDGCGVCKSRVRVHGMLVLPDGCIVSHVRVCMSATCACVHLHHGWWACVLCVCVNGTSVSPKDVCCESHLGVHFNHMCICACSHRLVGVQVTCARADGR